MAVYIYLSVNNVQKFLLIYSPTVAMIWLLSFETMPHYIAQASLELTILLFQASREQELLTCATMPNCLLFLIIAILRGMGYYLFMVLIFISLRCHGLSLFNLCMFLLYDWQYNWVHTYLHSLA